MKMVKSLLLGSAAGLVAVAGAQAADLPVKAKAVEYVKVCSLYGAGFYYIPGTDTCIKIGGYVRYEGYHNGPTGNYLGIGTTNAAAGYTRHSNTWTQQARFRQSMDVRSQTEYGTLRAYAAYGTNFLNANAETAAAPSAITGNFTFAMERAFIQFAGFTIGRSDTFFAFYNGAAYGFVPTTFGSSSGPAGLNVAAYTWQFGNGVSATISLEDAAQHNKNVADLSTAATQLFGATAFGAAGNDYAGQRIPDIVGNIRVDQAWGSAQIMGALHEVRGRYYTGPFAPFTTCAAVSLNTTACGNPGDEWGWAVGAGITLKMPWDPKDTLSIEAGYTEGALSYISSIGAVTMHKSGGLAFGPITDAIFANAGVGGTAGQLELTESWGIVGAFEHYWTPTFRQAIVAGYQEVKYNNNAKAIIAAAGCAGIGGGFTAGTWTNCNPDWAFWRVATRVLWNPVANLDVGVEVAYSKIDTAFEGLVTLPAPGNAATGLAPGRYAVTDQDHWTATFRIQRNFWP